MIIYFHVSLNVILIITCNVILIRFTFIFVILNLRKKLIFKFKSGHNLLVLKNFFLKWRKFIYLKLCEKWHIMWWTNWQWMYFFVLKYDNLLSLDFISIFLVPPFSINAIIVPITDDLLVVKKVGMFSMKIIDIFIVFYPLKNQPTQKFESQLLISHC